MTKVPVLLLAAILLLSGCCNLKHVSGQEFTRQIEERNRQTIYCYEHIGQADGKAYILHTRVPLLWGTKLKEKILFTNIEELNDEFLEKLKRMKPEQASNRQGETMSQ